MRKLNNKGFAISTVIYGISVMGIMLMAMIMANMSATRKNNNEMAKTIEADLNRVSRTEVSFGPLVSGNSPLAQEYKVPVGESGWYRVELWGSQGGEKNKGGRGAYTTGIIELHEGERLFFYVGENKNGVGGSSTEVRVELDSSTSATPYNSNSGDRIMVAAGGGVNEGADGGTLIGQTPDMASHGGLINISNKTYQLTDTTLVGYSSSYPTSLGSLITGCSGNGEKPNNGDEDSNVGGDGYVGSKNANSGGVSFILGYGGCKANVTYNSRLLYFVDGFMMAGVKNGDGFARIERIVSKNDYDTLPRRNQRLNGVTAIRDCTKNKADRDKSSMIAMSGGSTINVPTSSIVSSGNSKINGLYCVTYNLGSSKDLDEIALWHTTDKIGGVDIVSNRVEVNNSSGWTTVKDILRLSPTEVYNKASETETPTGNRISAYQHDPLSEFPERGDYYLIPVLTENKVVTAAPTEDTDSNPITFEYLTGDKRQKWSIEKIINTNISPAGSYEYKIVELARFKALAITFDENMIKNTISAQALFNDYARNEPQIWNVRSMGDGTYAITTVVETFDNSDSIISGSLVAQTTPDGDATQGKLVISRSSDASGRLFFSTQRFRLYDINYSSNS